MQYEKNTGGYGSCEKACPTPAMAWERLNVEFQQLNDDLDKAIGQLTEKVAPLMDQRPVPCRNEKAIESVSQYNSQLWQAFHQKLISFRCLVEKLRELNSSIEI